MSASGSLDEVRAHAERLAGALRRKVPAVDGQDERPDAGRGPEAWGYRGWSVQRREEGVPRRGDQLRTSLRQPQPRFERAYLAHNKTRTWDQRDKVSIPRSR